MSDAPEATIEIVFNPPGNELGPIMVRQGDRAIRALCRDEALWVVANLLAQTNARLYNCGMMTDAEYAEREASNEKRRDDRRREDAIPHVVQVEHGWDVLTEHYWLGMVWDSLTWLCRGGRTYSVFHTELDARNALAAAPPVPGTETTPAAGGEGAAIEIASEGPAPTDTDR